MSWLFSQALVEEYSAANCLDGEPFAQLNVMPTPHKFWRNDKMMGASDLSRFGLTLRLLTESHGEELLMSYRAAFPVRTSALPAKEQVSQDRAAACGATWRASLAKYDPDESMWKTAQRSFLEDSVSSLEIWPRWGSMRNGELYQRAMLAHPICENESGFSHPTPTTRDWKGASNGQKEDFSRWTTYLHHAVSHDHYTTYPNPSSSEAVMGWPIGWTELAPLEMDKFQQWRQQHGGF